MKLSETFILHNDGEETVLVSTGDSEFSGIVKLNPSAASIVGLFKEDTDEEQVIQKMLEMFDAPRETIERDVNKVVSQLREIGAIIG